MTQNNIVYEPNMFWIGVSWLIGFLMGFCVFYAVTSMR